MQNTPSGAARKRTGFEIFLYFLLGIGALLFAVAIVGFYLLLKTERGQEIVQKVKGVSTMAMEGMSAPGTEELRALGCESALVTTTGRIAELSGGGGSEEAPAEAREEKRDIRIVICNSASLVGRAPDCSAVAATYGAAVEAPEEFAVAVVNARLSREVKCQGFFSPSGEKLRDLPIPAGEPSP